MSIFDLMGHRLLSRLEETVRASSFIVSDANLSPETFKELMRLSSAGNTPVFFDGTSDPKSVLPVVTNTLSNIDVLKVNASELSMMVVAALRAGMVSEERQVEATIALRTASSPASMLSLAVLVHQLQCRDGIPYSAVGKHVFVTLGSQGVLWVGVGSDRLRHYASLPAAPIEAEAVVSTSGAGDCFLSAIVCGLLRGMSLDIHRDDAIVRRALVLARDSLRSRGPVPSSFSS